VEGYSAKMTEKGKKCIEKEEINQNDQKGYETTVRKV
jgi:hypothetical protein